MMNELQQVQIWCDGACSGNPGAAGWGAVLIYGNHTREVSGYIGIATNNIAEVTAANFALQCLKRPCIVTVYSDSKYLIEGAKGAWKITTNMDYWQALWDSARPHQMTWEWIKGHSGLRWNEHTNVLANNAAYRGK